MNEETHTSHRPDCPHCHARNSVQHASPLWRIGVAAGWLVMAGMVMFISLIGPFILLVGPVVALSGAGLLSFLHARAGEPPTCDACGKISAWEQEPHRAPALHAIPQRA